MIPKHYLAHGEEYLALIDQYCGPLGKKATNQMKRAVRKPSNDFWCQFIHPNLIGGGAWPGRLEERREVHYYGDQAKYEEDRIYLPVTNTVRTNGQSSLKAETMARQPLDESQGGLAFFTNFLRYGVRSEKDGWESPKSRVFGGPYLFLTVEYDPDSAWSTGEKQQFMAHQLGWFRRSGSNDLDSPIGGVYQHLRQYSDFRGIVACWSGNKSVHITFTFHVDPLFQDKDELRFQVAGGYEKLHDRLCAEVQGILGAPVDPDPALRRPSQYRKLPNGVMTVEKQGHILDISPGTKVPLVCLWEKLLPRSARGANRPFVTEKVLRDHAEKRKKRSYRHRRSSIGDMTPDEHAFCSERARELVEQFAGDKGYPTLADLTHESVWVVRLCARKGDNRPSTLILENGHETHWQGGKEPEQLLDIVLPLGFHLRKWRDEYARLIGLPLPRYPNAPERGETPEKPEESRFREDATSHDKAYELVAEIVEKSMNEHRYALVRGPEGSRKTTAALRHAPTLLECLESEALARLGDEPKDHEVEDAQRTWAIFSFKTYDLAREKATQFNQQHRATKYRAIVLPSFSKEYGRCAGRLGISEKDFLTPARAAQRAYPSLTAAIKDQQPEVWDRMHRRHRALRRWLQGRGFQPVFFVVHEVLHKWSNEGITSAYWHPKFFKTEPKDWWLLRKEMGLRLAVHDEVNVEHLMSSHEAYKVDWYRAMARQSEVWSEPDGNLADRWHDFRDYLSQNRTDIEFDEVCEIHEIEYAKSDKQLILGLESYDNQASERRLYEQTHGNEWYAKPRSWWTSVADRLLLLTTEMLPTEMVRGWNDQRSEEQKSDGRAFEVYSLASPHLITDEVSVMPRKKCRSKDARDVVRRLRKELGKPNLPVITNCAKGDPNTYTHAGIRGSNRLIGQDTAQILLHKPTQEYEQLQLVNQLFGLNAAIRLSHIDQFNQTAGRTLGFRHRPDAPVTHYLVIGYSLWYKLEDTFLDHSRYGLAVLADAKSRKSARSNERQADILSAHEGHEDMMHIIEDYERERAGTEAFPYEPDLPDDDFEHLMEEELYELEVN